MLVIENCNSLSDLRQKLIDGEEVRTARNEPGEGAISRQDVLDIVDGYSESQSNVEDVTQDIISDIMTLPSANLQKPKIGHWIYKIYGGFHEQGDWYCSHCDYQFNYGNGHARHCPECGYEMSETPTEEVMSEYDKRRCNYPNDI